MGAEIESSNAETPQTESISTDAELTPKVKPTPEPAEVTPDAGTLLTTEEKKEGPDEGHEEKNSDEEDSKTNQKGNEENEEKFEFKLPEGSTLNPAHVDKTVQFAKELGLSDEAAQKLIDRDSMIHGQFVSDSQRQLKETTSKWFEEVKADPELGGENLNRNAELAKRVVNRFGSDQLKEELNATGFGNHPELFRFTVAVGKAISEDQLVHAKSQDSKREMSVEEKFYGKQERAV